MNINKIQILLYNILERPERSKYGFLVSKLIFINIFINIFIIIGLTFFSLKENMYHLFDNVNTINVNLFIVELIARYIAVGVEERYRGFIGRVKYTFNFYTIIDILSIIPFFTSSYALSYLRFLRLLKVSRFREYMYKIINFEIFVTSNIFIQFIILFFVSFLIVFIFRFTYENSSLSISLFLDPSALADTSNIEELIVGIIEAVIGLIVGGTLISIITESISQKADSIKKGFSGYKLKNHTIIINRNEKLNFILDELNIYYESISYLQEVAIFLPNFDNIEYFYNNLNKYSNLDIKVITGEIFHWDSFDRISINRAEKIILLEDEDGVNKIIKTIRFITSNENFHNKNLKFTIEVEKFFPSLEHIYNSVTNGLEYCAVKHQELIEMFLNRSIIDINYFRILADLLSFNGTEFYILPANEIIDKNITYQELFMKLNDVILIGVIKDSIILNPSNKEILITPNDKLVCMCEDKSQIYNLNDNVTSPKTKFIVPKPQVKEEKKLCVVGDFNDLNIHNVTQFLTKESIEQISRIVRDDYMNKELWEEIEKQNFDLILLALKDEEELLVTLYLKDVFKDNPTFLNKIVNILHDSNTATLLEEKDGNFNIILSSKVMGQYMAQVTMSKEVEKIFDEVTHSYGNEFYILSREKYNQLFELSYEELKYILLENDIVYIGVIKEDKFVFNSKNVKDAEKIVVLTEGVE